MGLPPGQEGLPGWMWLDARDVVSESLRDIARGKAVSVPSLRYKAIVGLARVVPARPAVGRRARALTGASGISAAPCRKARPVT